MGNSYSEPPTVYALLNSYVNFNREEKVKISDLAKTGRGLFFDFDYPLATGISKEYFETMILNHFLMRRIGYETVTSFKIALNVKLNEIMPLYNKLFESIENWSIFNDGETVTRSASDSRSTSNTTNNTNSNTTVNTVNNSTSNSGSNSSTSDRRFSDTPENQLADVRSGSYVSEYNYDQDNSTISNNTTSNTTNNTTNNSTNNGTNNTLDNGTQNESISRTPSDKMRLYTEFLQNRQNIYTMIFRDLDSLFYQLI